ncbi:hypothetical protein [Kitasatospora sp. NPDC088548]|uniref:hypothetical protein n=1 Tax=Kitasatospora sp. NPDC088548 TaxID=3364075 RepID=UPI0037F3BEEA
MPGPKKIGVATADLSTGEQEYFFVYDEPCEAGTIAVRRAAAWSHNPNLPPMHFPRALFSAITLHP